MGLTSPPSDPDFIVGKNEVLQMEILISLFLVHKLLDFWVPGPPPPLFEENSGPPPPHLPKDIRQAHHQVCFVGRGAVQLSGMLPVTLLHWALTPNLYLPPPALFCAEQTLSPRGGAPKGSSRRGGWVGLGLQSWCT